MRRPLIRTFQLVGAVLPLAMLAAFVQPGSVHAAPVLGLTKAVAVGSSTYGTSQNAVDGSTLRYQITYSNNGTDAMPLVITDTLNPGQSLSFYSAGCTNTDPSLGPVTVTCTVPDVPTATNGTVIIGTIVNSSYGGTISNTASASATGATTATSNTTTVAVSGPPPPNSGFTLQKFVAVNGGAAGTSVTANSGDTLTYTLQFTNNTGSTLSTVALSDTLSAGQAFIATPYSSNACANYSASTSTVTCTLSNVPPGTFSVFFQTGVQNGSSTITNQASATVGAVNGIGGVTVNSNSTYVTVGQAIQYFTNSFTICGTVASYVPSTSNGSGSLGFFGQSYAIAANSTATGQPIAIGENACFAFTTNTFGQIVAVNVTPNLTGVNVVCGTYTAGANANTIVVSGNTFGVNGTFVPSLIPGIYYCFVVDNTGAAYILLGNTPTGVTAPNASHRLHSSNGERAL